MADLQVLESQGNTYVTVDASATTFLTGYAIANDGSGNWVLADGNTAARQDVQYFCLESVSAGGSATYSMPVAKRAVMQDRDASAYTAGGLLFLTNTPGTWSHTQPTLANTTIQKVLGKALTANIVVLNADVIHYSFTWSQETATVPVTALMMGIANRPMRLIEGRTSFDVTCASGTVDVYKAASGTRVDSGTQMTTGTAAWSGTAGTPVMITPSATATAARVATGDQFGIKIAGTLTNLAGACVHLVFVDEQLI